MHDLVTIGHDTFFSTMLLLDQAVGQYLELLAHERDLPYHPHTTGQDAPDSLGLIHQRSHAIAAIQHRLEWRAAQHTRTVLQLTITTAAGGASALTVASALAPADDPAALVAFATDFLTMFTQWYARDTATPHSTRDALDFSTKRSVDSLPINSTSADMLDLERVAQHIQQASERGRYTGSHDPHTFLLEHACLAEDGGQLRTTIAGLLCFGRNPQAVLPQAVVDLGHYRANDPLSFDVVHLEKKIGGTLLDQIERVETYLWANIHHGMTVTNDSSQRVERHAYPRVVLRELTVNMLVHRDYNDFSAVARVQLFRNRIEWTSPGGLPDGVTVENILDEQRARNRATVDILYEAGYVEAFGQGLNTVVSVLQREQLPPPRFQDHGRSFAVTVYGQMDDRVDPREVGLNSSQQRILKLVRSRRSITPAELLEHAGTRSRRSIQRDLSALIEIGLMRVDGEGRALRYFPSDE